jgi:UDP-N-acetylglucosamine--N-acetylmuramyl-(pentapeptide) pyrophosphoryl-undecaprenol N-acetylglucosamine transferase
MITTICFVAGASGGHIIPALTLAQDILKKNPAATVHFFSTHAALDRTILAHCPEINHKAFFLDPLPTRWWSWPLWMIQCVKVFLQSVWWFYRHRPERLISMGGLISLPVCYAAKLMRIPFYLYELNAVPGKAVKFLAPYADKIFITMLQTKNTFSKYTCEYTSYPVRYSEHDKIDAQQARLYLGLQPNVFTLVIMGGSQGSQFINKIVQQFVTRHWEKNNFPFQIIHQTGEQDREYIQKWYQQHNIPALVFAYRPDIAWCYNAADCVIARAGAGTLFELQFFNKPSIIIPLETSVNNHQLSNAYAMHEALPTLFSVLRQNEIQHNPHLLDTRIYAFGQLAGLSPKTA